MADRVARATVECMRQDPTFKDIFAYWRPGVARKRRIRGGWGLTLDTLRVATDDLRRDNAAARLAGLIAEIGDADALAHVGDWIVDSPTGNELIARFGKGS